MWRSSARRRSSPAPRRRRSGRSPSGSEWQLAAAETGGKGAAATLRPTAATKPDRVAPDAWLIGALPRRAAASERDITDVSPTKRGAGELAR